MKEKLLGLLGIETGEESMVSLLLTQSVFLGIFFGAFDISAHSLFLSVFDEKMMARAYVISGLAGIILTSVYTRLQRRMLFRNFATLNLFFVTFFTLFLWVVLLVNPSEWVTFLVFIMLGPLNILALLGFWGTAGRLFTLRQGKRLFGLVDAGLLVGIIISCYAIPVMLSLNFESHNILLVSAVSVMTGSLLQILIGSRFRLSAARETSSNEKTEEKQSLFRLFREDSYIRIMGIFIALSVMTAFFVQYSFMAVTREQYPSEEDMARFLGLFTGSMMIFTLLVKILVFSYLIRNYGLRTCLALSPILLSAFTVIAILIGMLMGYTPATSGFMLFFMLLALSRLFSKALKDSIESPSFKVIYQTIGEKVRYEIQSGMDGTVNEISALISGLLLAGLGIMSFVKLIHFSWVLVILTVIWVFVAIKLYSEYRKSIRKALEPGESSGQTGLVHTELQNPGNSLSAKLAFENTYFSLISGNTSVLQNNTGKRYLKKILDHADSATDFCLIPALKKLSSDNLVDPVIRQKADIVAESLELKLSLPSDMEDKTTGMLKLLAGSRPPQTTQVLRLLRDKSPQSKKIGMLMIGKFRIKDMIPEVCECLNIKGLEFTAASILRSFGGEATTELSRYYMSSSGNPGTSRTILRLLGSECHRGNEGFLLAPLWSGSRQLRETSLRCLSDCGFKPGEEEKDRLHQLISDTIGIMAWNISAKIVLHRKSDSFLLYALGKEISRWNKFLFGILAITYDPTSIARIEENLESGTVEGVNYALEMVDIVIDDSIKPKLIPLLDIIPDEERYRNLYQFFPAEIPDYNDLIVRVLNRDYNLTGIWIRACILRSIDNISTVELTDTVIALLFSPKRILQEEAIRLIGRTNRMIYDNASERIPGKIRIRLDEILNGVVTEGDLLFEKVKFLSACFTGIDEEDLIQVAENLNYFKSVQAARAMKEGGCILWRCSKNETVCSVEIIDYSASMQELSDSGDDSEYLYLLPLIAVEEFNYSSPEHSLEIIKYIEKNQK